MLRRMQCVAGVSPGCFPGFGAADGAQQAVNYQNEELFNQRECTSVTYAEATGAGKAALPQPDGFGQYHQYKDLPSEQLKLLVASSPGGPGGLDAAWSMLALVLDRLAAVETVANAALSTATVAHNAWQDLTQFAVEPLEQVEATAEEAYWSSQETLLERAQTPSFDRVPTGVTDSGLSEADSELMALKARLLDIRHTLTRHSDDSPISKQGEPTPSRIDPEHRLNIASEIARSLQMPFESARAGSQVWDGPGLPDFDRAYAGHTRAWISCPQRAVGDIDASDPCDDADIAGEAVQDGDIAEEGKAPDDAPPAMACNVDRFRCGQSSASTIESEPPSRNNTGEMGSDDSGPA